jgi:energy-coupling factor transporter ATP-binding protein EcfA2
MLGLELRDEFRGRRLKGTQIELPKAIQMAAADFLRITYPSGDVLKAVEAIGPQQGRPVVLIGERGQGKSHLMAALVHALNDSNATRDWLSVWADRLQEPKVADIPIREGMFVISENLHRQNYKFLWDLLFERHPKGEYIKGKWEALGDRQTNVPSYELLKEMFTEQPTALVLDEYQTWFDGLTNSSRQKSKTWAFNFMQLLSELAKEHPELVVLVVSLRNGDSEAYRQIHRVNPALVDWKGVSAKRDRQRLLLHRLFENRLNIDPGNIESALTAHISEHLRLADVPPAEHERTRRDFIESWPFAPHLMQLLEDQVLVATSAQETRDLIKILADLYKHHGEGQPIITAADFRLDDDRSGIASLIDSVANQHHQNLREKALRNMEAVRDAVRDATLVPHLPELVSSLWVRSLAVGNLAGATASTLHVDVTRAKAIDDNSVQDELNLIVENSFNIHQQGDRLIFKDEENPQARLMASARNDRLFASGAAMHGQDLEQLAKETRYVIGDTTAQQYRIVVLGRHWLSNPWDELDESERPERWTDQRIPLVVLPECPDKIAERLGTWLRDNLQKKRNTVRFLIPHDGANNAYYDRDLVVLARAVCLAEAWKVGNPEYRKLKSKYEGELRNVLKKRFNRFAVLDTWNYADPARCEFHIISHKAHGAGIPEAVDKYVREQLFIPEDFQEIVEAAAENSDSVAKLLDELQEPRPNQDDCVPWIGETLVKERIERLCSKGIIAIDLRGSQYLQKRSGEDEDVAWRRIKGKLGTGKHLEETKLLMPQAVPQTGGVSGGDQPGGTTTPGGQTTLPGNDTPAAGGEQPGQTGGQGGVTPAGGDGANTGATPGGDTTTTTTGTGSTGSIFGGGDSVTTHRSPATSPLNLLSKVEGWGIGNFTQVKKATVTIEGLTGAKLTELIKKLPDGLTYALDIEKED